MKILSFHPFSLYANGGGSRILRRLYEGREDKVTSLVVESSSANPASGPVKEVVVYATPTIKPWARWKLRNLLTRWRIGFFKPYTIRKIQNAAIKIEYDVLHVINHYTFSAALCHKPFTDGKQLWVSFHDHYDEIKSPVEDTRKLWLQANRRLVISNELGNKYKEEFGDYPFEIVTDGVKDNELTVSSNGTNSPAVVYFAGLLHITYLPLFETLANALDALTRRGYSFKLILRGTQNLNFLQGRSFVTEYRPMTLNNSDLKAELDAADILYLPIKFTNPHFYLYSLSTKMVGYLAAPGAILYHGPADSAANHLLTQTEAAVSFKSIDIEEMTDCIIQLLATRQQLSANAKILAKNRFEMSAMQNRFWQSAG